MCLYPFKVKIKSRNGDSRWQTVNCGKCLECLKGQTTEWALRICLEAKQWQDNCCITLTYDNDHVNSDYLLCRKDIQLFIKSLRKALEPVKIRYFYSGEYGEKRGRPHFHVIFFNYKPDDLVFAFRKHGHDYFRSPTIKQLWKRGEICVGHLDFETAFYCAKYLQKYAGCEKEVKPFVGMSLKPGIGYKAITDDMVKDGRLYYDGKVYPIPRYFQKVLEKKYGILDDRILNLRSIRIGHLYQTFRCRNSDSHEKQGLLRESSLLGKESWEFFKKSIDN